MTREEQFTMYPCVDALCMPQEVDDWCCDNDISTHYATELYRINDDGNPLAEWLKSMGYEFVEDYTWVGIFGT